MYRILATTVLAGLGVLFSPPALAQVTFSSNVSGSLVQPSGNFYRLETFQPSTVNVTLDSGYTGTVEVTAPAFISGPNADPGGTTRTATVTFPGGSVSNGQAAVELPPGGPTLLTTSMAIQRPTIYPAGTYNYQVVITVTATPP